MNLLLLRFALHSMTTRSPAAALPCVLFADADYRGWLCTYAPGQTMARHAHPTTSLSVVLSGELEEQSHRTTVTASSLSVVVKPADVPHENRFGPRGARMLAIEFAPAFLERLNGHAQGFGRWRWGHGGVLAAPVVQLWRAASEAGAQNGALDDALVTVIDTFREEPPAAGSPPDWLQDVRDRLHDEFAAPPQARTLADDVGVHRVYLARRFRQHFGCSTTAYVQRLRVRAAAAALASAETPLVTVALDTGFADQSHLCRTFKAATGMTPGRFRALMHR
ncbi:MAG: helix-turn-helix transcriptional regulator [Rhodothermaceae bacterium]|nr:helix-turn-helix transcriptional regulator [Rhodothermaceae bacterium]